MEAEYISPLLNTFDSLNLLIAFLSGRKTNRYGNVIERIL